MLKNGVWPSGLKVAPANSLALRIFRTKSKYVPAGRCRAKISTWSGPTILAQDNPPARCHTDVVWVVQHRDPGDANSRLS
jgi:hypothetical protein